MLDQNAAWSNKDGFKSAGHHQDGWVVGDGGKASPRMVSWAAGRVIPFVSCFGASPIGLWHH